jgi:hypothetical protein
MWAKVATVAAIATGLAAPGQAFATPHANYYGGPVMTSEKTVLVLWGPYTNASLRNADDGFLAAVAHDSGTTQNVFAVLPEYSTVGATVTGSGTSSNQMLWYSQTYAGMATITPAGCTGSTCTVAQISAELVNQINAGQLPAPVGNGLTTVYNVLFPISMVIQDGNSTSGVNFCATHGNTALASGTKVVFTLLPDDSNTGTGCGAGTVTQNETSMLSHELREAITDPLIREASNTIGPPVAWYDPQNGELDDLCFGQEAPNSINGGTWTVQKEWSNKANACVSSSNYGTPAADFSANPYEPVTFNGSGSSPNGDKSMAKFSWDFGDGSSGDGATVQHLYPAAGTYHVTLTAFDSLGFKTTIAHDVVALAPDQQQPPQPGGGSTTTTTTAPPPAGTGGSDGSGGFTQPPPTSPTTTSSDTSPGSITSAGAPITTAAGVVNPGIVVSCGATVACSGTVVVTAGVPAALAAKLKRVTLATSRFTVKPGGTQTIAFKLSKAGAKLLRKLKKLKVSIRVTLSAPGFTAPVVLTRVTTLTPPASGRAGHAAGARLLRFELGAR